MPSTLKPWVRGLVECELLMAALACGDAVEPTLPDVSGVYVDTTTASALTCTPQLVNQGPNTITGVVRVEQHGSRVTLRVLELEGQNIEHQGLTVSLSLDREGRFRLEPPPTPWLEVVRPEGKRYVQARYSGSGRFDWTAHPITFTGAGTVTEVHREGSVTGPVVVTCTQQQTNTATRTGP